jgi:transcriptional regulator
MARANPQWQHFASGHEVLAIFHGPHTYLSPTDYETAPAVPTWIYTTVHAYGVPSIVDDPAQVVALLEQTISKYESAREEPWDGALPEEYRERLVKGIVAFEIPISRLEGKFKLGQNRAAADLQRVHAALSQAPDADSQLLAALMRVECEGLRT